MAKKYPATFTVQNYNDRSSEEEERILSGCCNDGHRRRRGSGGRSRSRAGSVRRRLRGNRFLPSASSRPHQASHRRRLVPTGSFPSTLISVRVAYKTKIPCKTKETARRGRERNWRIFISDGILLCGGKEFS